ncbi:MAG: hypothetical protein AB1632_00820 [Nitrospirota bacterium]
MMVDVKAKIDELQKLVAIEINESKLIETGGCLLDELRKLWHTQKKGLLRRRCAYFQKRRHLRKN